MPYYYDKALNRYKATNLINQSQWFDKWEDAEAFSKSGGPVTEYRGFTINRLFQITKDGKPVFTAPWQLASDMEGAKLTIDNSLMVKEVFDKFPNISKIDLKGICELENGTEESDRFRDWNNDMAERGLQH